ncbi:MAG: hypothetical protein ACRDT4_10285 [Micromonosporaceae bacterium]
MARVEALRVAEAFPMKPAPRYQRPTPEQVRLAREDFALHIRSLFTCQCLAADCDGDWPCSRYRRAVPILERACQFDVNGQLRP